MKQYLDLLQYILDNGEKRIDRTGTGTISCFGYQNRYDLSKGFPLVTTKKVAFRLVMEELLWFISGDTNIKYLVDNNVHIWDEWPYAAYQKLPEFKGETQQEFIEKIKNDEEFAKKYGDLGPVYGRQWRNFNGTDQLLKLEESIKKNPFSRRHIICAWNPAEVDNMALPPCHSLMQFYVSADGKKLSCQLYQRSGDVFLGVPFNIASYALLTCMLAHTCGLEPGEFVHTFGDVHIYLNLVDQVHEQLARTPRALPKLVIKRKVNSIVDFKKEDFELEGYDPYPAIKGKVSV